MSSTSRAGVGIGVNKYNHVGNKRGLTNVKYILLFMSSLIFIGIFLCATMVPNEYINGPSTNSILSGTKGLPLKPWSSKMSLSERILEWIPRHHVEVPTLEDLPDWDKEQFWTPIDVDVSNDPMVILCRLNFKKYWQAPHIYPMFRDLEGISSCFGSNRRREKLSVLVQEVKDEQAAGLPGGIVVPPTGFVFHESRVGSTLVANFLASDPWALVFSESAPVANAILHCETCTVERQIQLFRDVIFLMGRSPIHKRLFFKFQSITCTKMEIALQAFPETSWTFLYRNPVQTMMSHLDPRKGGNAAPCLRSKRSPPAEVTSTLVEYGVSERTPNEAWCAAHLNMLCGAALRAYERYGSTVDPATGTRTQRGMLLNYDALPGAVPKVLLPLFGQTVLTAAWLEKMKVESKQYSKGRGTGFRLFSGDSKDKEMRATAAIQLYAKKILQPTYETLDRLSQEALTYIAPEIAAIATGNSVELPNWKAISSIPLATDEAASGLSEEVVRSSAKRHLVGHSVVLKEKEFVPWIPFSNHHSSKSIEPAACPMQPAKNYPKAYSMIDVTNNWNTDSTDIPAMHYDSLCHFDYKNSTHRTQAQNYRLAEVPFVIYNIPELDNVVHKWNNVDYLQKLLGNKKYRVEASANNHFMYWNNARGNFLRSEKGRNWKPPTDIVSSQFESWLELAVKGQNKTLENRTHQYFRVSSDAGNPWLFDELPFFKPVKSLFLVEPNEQKGIHCRFGMRSVIAEAHFDGSRNAVVMLGGLRRWILTHPEECKNMHMLPLGHPSGRHSEVDWSKPDLKAFPNFAKLMGNEVILQPGDYLYVPTYWIHYIVSLNVNFQCNTRSGVTHEYDHFIKECGF